MTTRRSDKDPARHEGSKADPSLFKVPFAPPQSFLSCRNKRTAASSYLWCLSSPLRCVEVGVRYPDPRTFRTGHSPKTPAGGSQGTRSFQESQGPVPLSPCVPRDVVTTIVSFGSWWMCRGSCWWGTPWEESRSSVHLSSSVCRRETRSVTRFVKYVHCIS